MLEAKCIANQSSTPKLRVCAGVGGMGVGGKGQVYLPQCKAISKVEAIAVRFKFKSL